MSWLLPLPPLGVPRTLDALVRDDTQCYGTASSDRWRHRAPACSLQTPHRFWLEMASVVDSTQIAFIGGLYTFREVAGPSTTCHAQSKPYTHI